jgi:hypothetical protein
VTLDELAAIQARADAAEAGPWLAPEDADMIMSGQPGDDRNYNLTEPGDPRGYTPLDHEGCTVWPWNHEADMRFAYAARADVPALLAEVMRLRAALGLATR